MKSLSRFPKDNLKRIIRLILISIGVLVITSILFSIFPVKGQSIGGFILIFFSVIAGIALDYLLPGFGAREVEDL